MPHRVTEWPFHRTVAAGVGESVDRREIILFHPLHSNRRDSRVRFALLRRLDAPKSNVGGARARLAPAAATDQVA